MKIESPALDGMVTTVVIEVKWSCHKEVNTALADQLGKKYLVGDSRTHGIYFVGLCNESRLKANTEKSSHPPGSLPEDGEEALYQQATEFEAENLGIRIVPIVVDLRWEPGRK